MRIISLSLFLSFQLPPEFYFLHSPPSSFICPAFPNFAAALTTTTFSLRSFFRSRLSLSTFSPLSLSPSPFCCFRFPIPVWGIRFLPSKRRPLQSLSLDRGTLTPILFVSYPDKPPSSGTPLDLSGPSLLESVTIAPSRRLRRLLALDDRVSHSHRPPRSRPFFVLRPFDSPIR